ncbi:hypothetical protein AAE478_009648 [Parahypoxylon ruwenzoriense]
MIGYEPNYFFYRTEATWRLSQIPDPQDANPVRYALLASFVEALVSAFDWKLEQGLRRDGSRNVEDGGVKIPFEAAPSWTSRVKPLAERLNLRPSDADGADPTFLKRNIDPPMGYLYSFIWMPGNPPSLSVGVSDPYDCVVVWWCVYDRIPRLHDFPSKRATVFPDHEGQDLDRITDINQPLCADTVKADFNRDRLHTLFNGYLQDIASLVT